MQLLVVNFGAYIKDGSVGLIYELLFCSVLQKLILNLVKYLDVFETCMTKC